MPSVIADRLEKILLKKDCCVTVQANPGRWACSWTDGYLARLLHAVLSSSFTAFFTFMKHVWVPLNTNADEDVTCCYAARNRFASPLHMTYTTLQVVQSLVCQMLGGFPPRRSGHSPGLGCIGFVVNKAALEKVSRANSYCTDRSILP
jgi:hypothetical protein